MKLLRLPDLIDRGLGSRSSIYARMERGEFPRPVKIGRINGWPAHVIDAYIEARIAEREVA
jgi:prophage regulatory protein